MSIKINHLTHVYGENSVFEKKALDDINLEINDGEFIGLIGHTGSGKSTPVSYTHLDVYKRQPPEPYKGKGIKYADEHIRRKVGKTGKK